MMFQDRFDNYSYPIEKTEQKPFIFFTSGYYIDLF